MAQVGIMIDQVAKTNPNPQKLNTTTSLVNKLVSTPAGNVQVAVPTTSSNTIVSNKPESVMSLNVKNGATTGNGGTYNAGYGTSTSLKANTTTSTPIKQAGSGSGQQNLPGNNAVKETGAGSQQQVQEPVQQVVEETPTTSTKSSGGSSVSSVYSMIQSMYEAQRQQAIAEIQRAMEKAVANYQNQIDNLGQNYDPLRNQSEVERYKSEQALKEQLANGGNTYSGMGRQEQLNLQNNYSNALNSINMQQQNELDALTKAIADAKQEGEYQKANAGYNYDIANYNAMINQANDDRDYAWKQYLQSYQEQQDALKNKYNYGGNTLSTVVPKSSSGSTSSFTDTKTKINAAKSSGQVYEGIEDDIDTYYNNMGTYPLSSNAQKFITQYNTDAKGRDFADDDIKTYIQAARQSGAISDYDAVVLYKKFGLE